MKGKFRFKPLRLKKTLQNNGALKLNFIKTKIFNYDSVLGSELESATIDFKRSLKILFEYQKAKKSILFVGASMETLTAFLKKMPWLRKSGHFFIPENVWVRGVFTNKSHVAYKLKTKKLNFQEKSLVKNLQNYKNIKLLVVLGSIVTKDLMREAYRRRIVIIAFSPSALVSRFSNLYQPDYCVEGHFDFTNAELSDFVFSIIAAVLHRAKKRL